MVRISAIAILTLAASALAAPQAPNNGDNQIIDSQGNPLTGDKKAEFLKKEQEGEAKFKELVGTYNEQQEQLERELRAITEKQDEILGFQKDQQA